MRILLTGAAGFLGSHALRHFLTNTDAEIVCPVSFKHKGLPTRIHNAVLNEDGIIDIEWMKRTRVVYVDLRAPVDPVTSRYFGEITHIVNYASESHVDRSITYPRNFVENNVAVMLTMLEYARELNVRGSLEAFYQVSTDEVYGPAPDGHAHAEWEVHRPSNPYSASKSAQESLAYSYWRTYDIPVVITNCMNLIGEMQDREKFVPMVMSKLLYGERVPLHAKFIDTPIETYRQLDPDEHWVDEWYDSRRGAVRTGYWRPGSRYYLHARNMADAILFLMQSHLTRYKIASRYSEGASEPDRYHIVGEREIDNAEMAQIIATAMGKPLHFKFEDFHSSRPGHDLRYALDGSKMEALGWKRPVSLEQAIDKIVSWSMDHKEWL